MKKMMGVLVVAVVFVLVAGVLYFSSDSVLFGPKVKGESKKMSGEAGENLNRDNTRRNYEIKTVVNSKTGDVHAFEGDLEDSEFADLDVDEVQYAPGQVIVKFKKDPGIRKQGKRVISSIQDVEGILRENSIEDYKEITPAVDVDSSNHIFVFGFSEGIGVYDVVNKFVSDPDVEYAEPNLIYETHQAPINKKPILDPPNDPLYPQQWHLEKIDAQMAWAETEGNPDIVIAVIDTGVDMDHEDLVGNIWTNPGEIPNNGIDDDNNGFIDDDKGWDFVDLYSWQLGNCWPGEDCSVEDNDPNDYYGHGTHVAGIIGATKNNNKGIVGVCPSCSIMPLKVGYAYGNGNGNPRGAIELVDVYESLIYATDNGADIISMSIGGGYSFTLKRGIDYAYSRGVILVASAGNNMINDRYSGFPAGYDEVIAVGSTNENDDISYFSNTGSWIDVGAPGSNILSTVIPGLSWGCSDSTGRGYGLCSGTSMSAPLVSGAIGLLLSKHQLNSGNQNEIVTFLQSSVDPLNLIVRERYIGPGRINAGKMLSFNDIPNNFIDLNFRDSYFSQSPIQIVGSVGGQGFVSYELEYGDWVFPSQWNLISQGTTPINNGILGTLNIPPSLKPGEYMLRLKVVGNNYEWHNYLKIVIDNTVLTGWPKQMMINPNANPGYPFGRVNPIEPVLVDIDNDGKDEIFFGTGWNTNEQLVYGYDDNGNMLPGFPIHPPIIFGFSNAIRPAVDDIDNDGTFEIIFGVNDAGSTWSDSIPKYFVYDMSGQIKSGWPVILDMSGRSALSEQGSNNLPVPIISNIDGGNDKELVLPVRSNSNLRCSGYDKVYVYKHDGTLVPGWPQDIECHPQVAVGDVDSNGDMEVVVISKPLSGSSHRDPRGLIYVFNHDGTIMPGWPVREGGLHPPVLGDIDQNDNGKLEIIFERNGCGYLTRDPGLFAYNHDGTVVPGWPVPFCGQLNSYPAIGDIDNNGDMEIVVKDKANNHDGTLLPGWPIFDPSYNIPWTESIIVDLEGDGTKEVIMQTSDEIIAYNHDKTIVDGFPKPLKSPKYGFPDPPPGVFVFFTKPWDIDPNSYVAVGDINGNGLIDLYAHDWDGNMYVWEFSGSAPNQDWPRLRHNPLNTNTNQ
jgi:subtilisin family serine protease